MRLREFLDLFGGMKPEELLERFSHPFLLELEETVPEDQERTVFFVRGGAGQPLVVGRGSQCHIRIRDRLVSLKHAKLVPPEEDAGRWQVVDQGSTNGTQVNEQPIPPEQPVDLHDGDRLSLSPASHFTFLLPETFVHLLPDLGTPNPEGKQEWEGSTDRIRKVSMDELEQQTATITVPEDLEAPTAVLSANGACAPPDRPPSGPQERHPHGELLLFCEGLDPVPLEIGDTVLVGRKGPKVHLVLPSAEVSRRHAELQRRPEGIYVRDLGSTNGTFIGALRLDTTWQRLLPRRRITIEPFELYVDEPQPSTEKGERVRPTDRVDKTREEL